MNCLGILIFVIILIFVTLGKAKGGVQQKAQEYKQQMRNTQPGNVNQKRQGQAGTYTKSAGTKKPQENDILARANQNVREQQMERQEDLKKQLQDKYGESAASRPEAPNKVERERQRVEPSRKQNLPESDLMQEINDLIVKGYDGDLNFSRDFVAEGIEMLNQIQM